MLVPACGSRCAREGASSEAEPARGRRGPSSEAEPPRGRRGPSSEADLARGVPCWATLVGCGGNRGVGCGVCVCFVLCSRCVCVLCFLQVLSRIPPGFLGTLVAVPDNCIVDQVEFVFILVCYLLSIYFVYPHQSVSHCFLLGTSLGILIILMEPFSM
jgi:hypothetical protein